MSKKKDGRSIPRDAMEHYRFQSLKLREKGWKVYKIAEAFGIHPDSVSRWFGSVAKHGKDSLKRKKARGKDPILNDSDKIKIISFLKRTAMDFGFDTPLWTCKRVQQVIKEKLNKSIAISNLWEALRKWKLSPQIPEKNYLEKDEKETKRWLDEEWPKIKQHCRRWQAMLYFQDESGVSLTPMLGKTWAPRGNTPKIKVTGKRGGFCVSSAISPAGKMVFRIEKGKVNRYTFVDFLKQIIKQHPHRKVIVVCDNARPHIAKYVKEFLISNQKRIAIYHIPPYSPELNPDEYVWKHLKHVKLKAHQAKNKEEFKPMLVSKMRSIQMTQGVIRSFFMRSILT